MLGAGDGMQRRVRIGTCSGPAEAAFVRSVFDAHELEVVINGEHHASVLGGLGGFVRLDILVDADHEEEAVALLRDIREGAHAVGDELPEDEDVVDGDARADADGVWDAKPVAADATHDAAPASAEAARPARAAPIVFDDRRRRTGAVLLLSTLAGFGAAHMSTGAWARGIALAVANVAAFCLLAAGVPGTAWILFALRFVDMLGALARVWSRPAPT
jgi:hypothetical protein